MEAQLIVDVCEVFTFIPSQNKLVKNSDFHDHAFSALQKIGALITHTS